MHDESKPAHLQGVEIDDKEKVLTFLKKLIPQLNETHLFLGGSEWNPDGNKLSIPHFEKTLMWCATTVHEIGHFLLKHQQNRAQLEAWGKEVEGSSAEELLDLDAVRNAQTVAEMQQIRIHPSFEKIILSIQQQEHEAWVKGLQLLLEHKNEFWAFLGKSATKEDFNQLVEYVDGHYTAYAAKFVRMVEAKFEPADYTLIQNFLSYRYFGQSDLYNLCKQVIYFHE